MFRSIRWRLVLSYVLLVLLTLGVVGAVILRLVDGYVDRQEQETLTANAEAVARHVDVLPEALAVLPEAGDGATFGRAQKSG